MGDSPPPGYSGGSVLETPATEIPMVRVQGGGGSGGDVFGEVPQIPIQRMVGGNGAKEDDIVTEAVITHIIASVLADSEPASAPAPASAAPADAVPATAPAPSPAPAPASTPAPAPLAAKPVMIENKKPAATDVPNADKRVSPVPLSFKPPTPVPPEEEPLPHRPLAHNPLPAEFEPTRSLKGTGKQTKLLWNYNGKNRIRVRTNLTDAEIKAFLTLKPEAFQLDERPLFDSLFFSDDDVRKYLVNHSEGFVHFWRRFIEYDGTDPVILYTTKEGRFYQDFLKNIANVRLKNLLGNVAYLLPPHKRSAYADPDNLVLGKQGQKTVKPPIEFLPTEVEKTKFTQGQFDTLVKPIEERLAYLDDKDVTDKITIDNFNKARKFVEVYKEVQKDMLVLEGMKSKLEDYKKENEPKIQGIMIIKQKISTASTQDRNYIAELTTQKEALDQINTQYTLYILNIDALVSKGEENLEFKKKVYDTLARKLEKMFKEPKAPAAAAAAAADEVPAPAPAPAPARAAKPGEIRRTAATEENKAKKLKTLKENVSSSTNAEEIITKVLKPFFNGEIWSTIRGTYGETGFLSNIFWNKRQKLIENNGQKYSVTAKYKTSIQKLKADTAEGDLWNYLDKLLFLEEYTPAQIEEIKEMLNKFIDVKPDYLKMNELYNRIYPKQTGGNLPRVPKRVTLRKAKAKTQA